MTRRFQATAGRLDTVVADALGIPRAEVQRAIASGGVLVDGKRHPKSFRLHGGEWVQVSLPSGAALGSEGPPVAVRYRDEHLLVVSKPAGVPTHPTQTRRTGTLVNRLLGMDVELAETGDPLRPGIVHRLDAGTSGLLVVACDAAARVGLAKIFRRHEADRRYLALVRGVVEHDRFRVEAPLGRRGARIRLDAVGGREAATAFEVRERFDRASLLEASPRTGRTHQIRVHLASVGHPILGDRRYGGGGDEARALGLTRPFLHSWRIGLDHPISGDRIEVVDPLPADLVEALRRVRKDRPPAVSDAIAPRP